jgi:hypothetical protein
MQKQEKQVEYFTKVLQATSLKFRLYGVKMADINSFYVGGKTVVYLIIYRVK